MNQSLENAVNAGLGDVRLLIHIFQGQRRMMLLKQLEDIEGL